MSFSHLIRVKVGAIPLSKLKKCIKTGKLNLTAAEVAGDANTIHVHPEVAEKLLKAKRLKKGARFHHSINEIRGDIQNMQGGSIWSWLKKAGKSVYGFAKDNWADIKPIVSKAVDAATATAASAAGPYAPGVILARQGLKSISGVGMKKTKMIKGSDAAKEHMARIRAMRKKKGGSFLPAGGYK